MKVSKDLIGKDIKVKNSAGDKEVVTVLRVEEATIWGKPGYKVEIRRQSGETSCMFPLKGARYRVVRKVRRHP